MRRLYIIQQSALPLRAFTKTYRAAQPIITRAERLRVIKCRRFFFVVVIFFVVGVGVELSRLRSTVLIRHCFVQAKWPTLARVVELPFRFNRLIDYVTH